MAYEIVIRHLGASSRTGETEEFAQSLVRIGRRPDNDVLFDRKRDSKVSGHHAEVRLSEGSLFVKDLGSKNGTWVGGKRIEGTTEIVPETEIRLGEHGPKMVVTGQRRLMAGDEETLIPLAAKVAAHGAPPSDKQFVGKETLLRSIDEAKLEARRDAKREAKREARREAQRGAVAQKAGLVGQDTLLRTVDEAKKDVRMKTARRFALLGGAGLVVTILGVLAIGALTAGQADIRSDLADLERTVDQDVLGVMNRHDLELASLGETVSKNESEISRLIVEIGERNEAMKRIDGRPDLSEEVKAELSRAVDERMRSLNRKLDELQRNAGAARGGGAERWADIAERYEPCVYLIAFEKGIGTGFAIRPDGLLATNAHVVRIGGKAWALQSGTKRVFEVRRMVAHPGWDPRNIHGPDVGLIEIETGGRPIPVVDLATKDDLRRLRIGTHVGTMGYPGELSYVTFEGGVPKYDTRLAQATFKDGYVGRITDYGGAIAPFDRAQHVQHSAATSGGTSGSPMFTAEGKVVAVNHAGVNYFARVTNPNAGPGARDKVARLPGGALINWGIRVDVLHDFIRDTGW